MKKIRFLLATAVLSISFLGCTSLENATQNGELQKAVPALEMETVELQDGDTYNLTAAPVTKLINGKEYTMLAYNGSIPGPLLKVPQGGEITVNFTNNTSMPNTLHSHGVRLENQFDGVPDTHHKTASGKSAGTQPAVQPGETFTYKLRFPDAGMYWYHPHMREDYAQELGLYGNFLVTPASAAPAFNREEAIFLDDILIENDTLSLSAAGADHTLMGRYGNIMLVNGVPVSESSISSTDPKDPKENFTLTANQGEVIRFYFTNAANVRPFNIAFLKPANVPISAVSTEPAATSSQQELLQLKLVGSDGGLYEKETMQNAVLINPSERATVDVLFETPGDYPLLHVTPQKIYRLGTITVTSTPAQPSYAQTHQTLHTSQTTIQEIDAFRPLLAKEPDKLLTLTVDTMMGDHAGHMMMSSGEMRHQDAMETGSDPFMADTRPLFNGANKALFPDGIEWEDSMNTMNQMSSTAMVFWKMLDQQTGKENRDINWNFKKDQPVKIRIFNDPLSGHPMQHPIHFHGQRFLVTARNGVPQTNLVWKDTTLVTAGETVDILLVPSNPGTWMAHCHIAEHLESGMMLNFTVEE